MSAITVPPPGAPTAIGWKRTLGAYFALTKPRIIELLLVTTFPAMVVAANGMPDLWLAVATLVGGALAAGGANTINCYIDRDIDAIMKRTHHRPLPEGLVTPNQALVFGISLSVISFIFLTLSVNLLTALLAQSAILFYVFVYTIWLKRSTVENIVIGGAAGSVPPLCGWAAVTGNLDAAPLIMFAVIFLWTPPHFWALAIPYTDDYAAAHVPMLPVTKGALEARRRSIVYSVVTVFVSLCLFATGDVGLIYLASAIVLGAALVILSIRQLQKATVAAAWSLFKYSTTYLALLFGAMVIDRLLPL